MCLYAKSGFRDEMDALIAQLLVSAGGKVLLFVPLFSVFFWWDIFFIFVREFCLDEFIERVEIG